jgi:outer membrane protein
MNNKTLIGSFVLVVGISVGLFIWNRKDAPKIAYVRSSVLVSSYSGMKEARAMYKEKMDKWKANIDTLQKDYQQALSRYNMEASDLGSAQKKERETYLRKQEENLRQYAGTLEQQAAEEDQKMTEGVLNQINTYIKEYGEKNGYDLILGITRDGNIMYGKEAMDITDDVLKGINASYKAEPEEVK